MTKPRDADDVHVHRYETLLETVQYEVHWLQDEGFAAWRFWEADEETNRENAEWMAGAVRSGEFRLTAPA